MDSKIYLFMKVHKKTLKTRVRIDKNNTLLGPVYIWVDHQLQRVKHVLPKSIQ